MRILFDAHVESDLERMLCEGETLKCGVWATIMATFKERITKGFIYTGAVGVLESNQYCLLGLTENRIIFKALSPFTGMTIQDEGSIYFEHILGLKIKKGLFGRAILYLDVKDKGKIKISITSSAIGSKITKQKEMREKLLQILADKFKN